MGDCHCTTLERPTTTVELKLNRTQKKTTENATDVLQSGFHDRAASPLVTPRPTGH